MISSWFKKKEKKTEPKRKKLDLDKYRIKMNVKSCCLYEQMTGKSFFKCETEEDALHAMYCSLIVNNDLQITYDTFLIMLEDERVVKWITDAYTKEMKFMYQMAAIKQDSDKQDIEDNKKKVDGLTMEDIATSLIMNYGMDLHYVMYDMELWEIPMLSKAANEKFKSDMADKRLWTYITVMPQIDHKKCKSPEKLIEFPWEKGDKKSKANKQMDANMYAIKHTIGMKLNIPDLQDKEDK